MSSSIETALVFTLDPPARIQWNHTKAGVKYVRVPLCLSVCVALCVSFSVSVVSLSVALFLCPSLSSILSLRSCLWPSGAHSLFVTCHLNRIAQSATAHAHRQQHAQLATRPSIFPILSHARIRHVVRKTQKFNSSCLLSTQYQRHSHGPSKKLLLESTVCTSVNARLQILVISNSATTDPEGFTHRWAGRRCSSSLRSVLRPLLAKCKHTHHRIKP